MQLMPSQPPITDLVADWSVLHIRLLNIVARTWKNCCKTQTSIRRYEIIDTPHLFAYQCASLWACPYIVAVLKLKNCQGSLSSNVIASIADHSNIVFCSGILRDHHRCLLHKVYGDKSDDTAFLFEHVIISYIPPLGFDVHHCNHVSLLSQQEYSTLYTVHDNNLMCTL